MLSAQAEELDRIEQLKAQGFKVESGNDESDDNSSDNPAFVLSLQAEELDRIEQLKAQGYKVESEDEERDDSYCYFSFYLHRLRSWTGLSS